MAGRPALHHPSGPLGRYMSEHFWFRHLDGRRVTNRELCVMFSPPLKPNMMSQWRTGTTRVALKRLAEVHRIFTTFGHKISFDDLLQLWHEEVLYSK